MSSINHNARIDRFEEILCWNSIYREILHQNNNKAYFESQFLIVCRHYFSKYSWSLIFERTIESFKWLFICVIKIIPPILLQGKIEKSSLNTPPDPLEVRYLAHVWNIHMYLEFLYSFCGRNIISGCQINICN